MQGGGALKIQIMVNNLLGTCTEFSIPTKGGNPV